MSDEISVEITVPRRNGGRLLKAGGKPGRHKGGAGRPPEWFKEICRDMVTSPKARAAAKAILEDSAHPQFSAMWKAVSERGYGKLEQTIEHVRKPYREAVDEMRKQAGLRLVG
jgi:hypothetical protein